MLLRYSGLKAAKFPDRLAGIRTGTPAAPVHVQLILSDLCNQACHFCAYRDPGYTSSQLFHVDGNYNPNRKMPLEKVLEVLDDCKEMGVRAIQLTGGGEPTVHPHFQRIVGEIMNRGFKWGVVTNGVKRHDFTGASWVRVSIDAGRAETYSFIRKVPQQHWHRAWETVGRYRAGVGFTVTPENWHEVLIAAHQARDAGASNFRISAQFSEAGDSLFKDFREAAERLCRRAEALGTPEFEVHNRFGDRLDDLHARPDYKRCGYQYFTTYIGADQNLYRCCVYAYNPRGKIGSLHGVRFKDAWAAAHHEFAHFDATGCARCQFNGINRNINEMVDPDASEVFV